ncbi:hypothetical protein [Pseudomonas sp.]|uniref:hypothetical protein n=1 Tax=Pseudomonas sp. TaxID=306 RepID=UPI0031E0FCBF
MENNLPMQSAPTSEPAIWLIGRSAEQPLMSVNLVTEQLVPAGAEKVDASKLGIDRLAPLLQTLPNLVVAQDVAQSRYMQVVIDGPLAAAANGEGFRAFSIQGGRIREHATLFEPERLQQLVSSAAMFQIASAVVAQKHLADISAKLSEIQAGVEGIATFLVEERKSKVKGALKYLRQVTPLVLAGELNPAIRQKLEDIELDLEVINDHVEDELTKLAQKAVEHKAPGLFETTAGLTAALKKMQSESDARAEEWKLCMGTRLVACRLLSSFPGEAAVVKHRQATLEKVAADFLGERGQLSNFKRAVQARVKGLTSYLDSQSTIQANRLSLREWEEDALPLFMASTKSDIGQMQQLLVEQQSPVVLTIEMRGNDVVGAYQSPAA